MKKNLCSSGFFLGTEAAEEWIWSVVRIPLCRCFRAKRALNSQAAWMENMNENMSRILLLNVERKSLEKQKCRQYSREDQKPRKNPIWERTTA